MRTIDSSIKFFRKLGSVMVTNPSNGLVLRVIRRHFVVYWAVLAGLITFLSSEQYYTYGRGTSGMLKNVGSPSLTFGAVQGRRKALSEIVSIKERSN